MLTLFEYYLKVMAYSDLHLMQRHGQCMFNILSMYRPDLSEQIRTTENDPFYAKDTQDIKFKNFINFIEKNWYNNAKA